MKIRGAGCVATGRMALDVEAALRQAADSASVVLVREEASTDDIAALSVCRVCRGLLTTTPA